MTRRRAAVLILVAWAGALGWLVERSYLGRRGQDRPSQWPVPPGSAYHAIRIGDRQYGLATFTVDTLPEGLRVTELVTIDLPPLQPKSPRRTSARVEALYTRGLQLVRWQSDLLTESGRSAGSGTISGDTLLTVVTAPRGDVPETLSVRLPRPVILPSAIPLVAASRGLPKPGSRLNLAVYDPFDEEIRLERLTVAAESVFTVPDSAEFADALRRWRVAHSDTVRAWRINSVEHGLPVSRWVDAAGMTVRLQHALGATFERSAFEIVNSNFRALPPPPWDSGPTAPRLVLTDGNPAPQRHLTLLTHLMPDRPIPRIVPSLEGGWQERAGDTLRIAPRTEPDSGSQPLGSVDLLTRGDSSIATAAARIVGNEVRPEWVARRLNDWVGRTITLRGGPADFSAHRTLSARRGTAAERATLLVALAHAAGLEARRVWGLAAVNGGWELRAWVEWRSAGGTWTPADPSSPAGQTLANRVRLATGGEPMLLSLALRAARLRLAVLEDTP